MLAATGYPSEVPAELQALRPLLADTFGANCTQVRNLDKQVSLALPARKCQIFGLESNSCSI